VLSAATQDGLIALLDLRVGRSGVRALRVRYLPTYVRHPSFTVARARVQLTGAHHPGRRALEARHSDPLSRGAGPPHAGRLAQVSALSELEVPQWNYGDETVTGPRFNEAMRELREQSWIARADPVGWITLDHEAVAFFMRSSQANFPGILMLEVQGITEGPMWDRMKGNLLDLRGEDHRRRRKLVQPAFSPREADRLRPLMRQELGKLWDAVEGDGGCDAVEAFAKPYPARMIAGVMGSPLEDAPRLGRWANLIQGQFDRVKIATMLPSPKGRRPSSSPTSTT